MVDEFSDSEFSDFGRDDMTHAGLVGWSRPCPGSVVALRFWRYLKIFD